LSPAAFFFLTCGRLRAPAWTICPGARGVVDMPLTVGVMPRGDGRYVLVDCGFAAPEMARPISQFGPPGLFFRFRADTATGDAPGPPRTIAAQLAERGIEARDVAQIVATHLHLDHIGGFVEFPNAEVLATPAEIEAVGRGGALDGYFHGKALRESGRLVPLELRGGERHGFPAHVDLGGDGRVLVLDAAGHTAGSVAVLLTDGTRSVLHAGDAAYHPVEYREGRQSALSRFTAFRRDWLEATWGRLRAAEADGLDVLLAHDPAGYERLTRGTAPGRAAPTTRSPG
jgi:glyoxylase-like metal-dependent hydrolase (beta-lactamase superfamily II)